MTDTKAFPDVPQGTIGVYSPAERRYFEPRGAFAGQDALIRQRAPTCPIHRCPRSMCEQMHKE